MDIEKILKDNNVLKTGHFLLSSGLHSDKYFEKFRILENPELVKMFGKMIADHFRNKNISIVCGPTTGGVIIAYEIAREMGVKCIIAEAKPGESKRIIRRGFTVPEGAKILIVDDVMTMGGAVKETIEALKPFPGTIIGIGVFIDRSIEPIKFNGITSEAEFFTCYKVTVENFNPNNCPLCKKDIPLEAPGRGAKI